ncbi:hypothetical protein R1flu_018680 [Riccia fluitans]|uniref:Uncharacterized protein n=1 Tax=Riccia fluitans TaxID=41844 RepID=A0ABD1ZGI2_9MARC
MRAPAPITHVAPKEKPDVSCSYILMVQHLIERCLLLYMNREDCVRALAKYARVRPVITNTVWKELEKENKEFFTAYSKHCSSRHARVFNQALEEATTRLYSQSLDCPEAVRGASDAPLQPCPAPLTS